MRMAKRLLLHLNYSSRRRVSWKQDCHRGLASSILNRFLSEGAKVEKDIKLEKLGGAGVDLGEECGKSSNLVEKSQLKVHGTYDPELVKDCSDDDDVSGWKWKLELAWLSRALEPALQLYMWASTSGSNEKLVIPLSTHSLAEVFTGLQLSKIAIQDWSFGDLTVGLYLIYLRQSSAGKVEDIKGVHITSDVAVQELIYHIELAKGAYKDNATALARHCMLRERNIMKFVKHSSVLRPGYYIGIDTRNILVIFGIRGTHTVYDLVTDVVSTSNQEMSFEGFTTHFGTAEAAQWFLCHEMGTIRKCLEKHKDFRLRIVGHSLGGAAAALFAIMLRKKSKAEVGFSPDIVSAVGFATPPFVSKILAENCASYVSTVVLQDDIIPRLSVASLARLRNEILETDWMSVLQKEDWKGVVDLVTDAKQFVSSIQDVARRLADYTKFRKMSEASDISVRKDPASLHKKADSDVESVVKMEETMPEELFAPGTLYYLKSDIKEGSGTVKSIESYTLWKRDAGEHFQRILLFGNVSSGSGTVKSRESYTLWNREPLITSRRYYHHQPTNPFSPSNHPNRSIASHLQRCRELKHLKSTYAAMIMNSAHQHSFAMNQFLAACSRLRRMDFALAAFDQMLDPNIFVYNAVIGGLVQSDEPISALHLFVEMPKTAHLRPSCHTFSFLIKACERAPDVGFGRAVHGQIWKMGFGSEVVLRTGLIGFYSRSCKIDETMRVFDEMGERDVFSWNSMIVALAHLGCLDGARRMFDEMPEKNIVSWNSMIMGYAKSGDVESAAWLFSQMPMKNLFSWTSMISCYSYNSCFKEAVDTFEQMKTAEITPDQVTMATVIAACAHLGALEVGKQVHQYAMLNGFELDVYMGSTLIDMYAKCGCLERSLVVFFKLEEKNLFCWNSMIDGLAIHGRGRVALDMFYRMKEEARIEPNWVSFVSVLSACARSGLVEEGRRMFLTMISDYSITPKMEHYCCMVDLLGRAGLLIEALDVIKSMEMVPSAVIWGALLGGCKIHGNLEIGKVAAEKLLALEPNRSSNYMLLVNMYAETNSWPDVATVRSVMKDNRVQKRSPGCSWIEIDRVVHEFAASDASHCLFDEIAFLLIGLDGQLKLAGNVPEWNSLH